MTDLRKAAEMVAYEVPLHELLEGVPESARLVIDSEDGMSTRFIPVGHLCKQAAIALRQALAQEEKPPVKSYCGGKPNYCTPVDAVNISQERVDETAKRKREWVGLTEADKSTAIKLIEAGMFNLAFKYLEEKLKEKNYESS